MKAATHYHDCYGSRTYWKKAISGYGVESGEAFWDWYWWRTYDRTWVICRGVNNTHFVEVVKE